jgi:hypothetical protein
MWTKVNEPYFALGLAVFWALLGTGKQPHGPRRYCDYTSLSLFLLALADQGKCRRYTHSLAAMAGCYIVGLTTLAAQLSGRDDGI